jgi:hypothetical protein
MIAISDTELYKAFQREFPKDLAGATEGKLSYLQSGKGL